jgi:hypothetical protein
MNTRAACLVTRTVIRWARTLAIVARKLRPRYCDLRAIPATPSPVDVGLGRLDPSGHIRRS